MSEAQERAAQVARASFSKLLALLASRTGDIASAEDALADALLRALETWPTDGVPANPEGWMLTVARNRLKDRFRSAAYRTSDPLDFETGAEPVMADIDPLEIPDERLKLLFVCAHPAIDESIHTPLMLQTVLGLEAADIANAFLVRPAAMSQRLVRAKHKIKAARLRFAVPNKDVMPERLDAVLEAIYGAYSINWNARNFGLEGGGEALFLADLLVDLLPDEAEVLGLAALLNFSVSRQQSTDTFVPLHEQDPAGWDATRIARADNLLRRAKARNVLGRFQLEAAIQAVHCHRRVTGRTDWRAIASLYEGLMTIAPTLGSAVAHAAALGEVYGPEAGLARLAAIEKAAVADYQPFWATNAHLCGLAGRKGEAVVAYERAIELTTSAAVRVYLEGRRGEIG